MKVNLNMLKGANPVGIAMTAISVIGAVAGTINDLNKTKKMDELIKKVDELTKNNS